MSNIVISTTKKNKPLLIYKGYNYTIDKINDTKVYWKCEYCRTIICKGRIHSDTHFTKILHENDAQNHPPIVANIQVQLDLYPGEPIGVLFPKREQADNFQLYILSTIDIIRVRVDTLHGAKGWEFRAVHIGGCELLYRMGSVQKRLIYTGILRGKTTTILYYSGHLPGYLEAALAVLEPPSANPSLDELFREK